MARRTKLAARSPVRAPPPARFAEQPAQPFERRHAGPPARPLGENLFTYLRQNFGLDSLSEYRLEELDLARHLAQHQSKPETAREVVRNTLFANAASLARTIRPTF